MPPELLRTVAPPGSEGDARKHAERLAALLPDEDAAVFFAGSTVLLAFDGAWDALERDDVQKELHTLARSTVLDLGRLPVHRVPRLDAAGTHRGRAVLLRTSAAAGGARDVADALRALPTEVWRASEVDGWSLFERRGDLLLVFRGGAGLARGVRRLVVDPRPARVPATHPRGQRDVRPPGARAEDAGTGPERRLRDVLRTRTSFVPALAAIGLFPDLRTLEDHADLGLAGPGATEAPAVS